MVQVTEKPLVTVVITTFNRNDYLLKAIRSVKAQDYQKLEVLVVDDNIDEAISAGVKELCSSEGLSYIRNFRKKGGCGARNSGIITATGKYIAFLDDDDIWLPNKLSASVDCLIQNPHASACYSAQYSYYEDWDLLTDVDYVPEVLESKDILKGYCPASTSIVMVRREEILGAGMFDESLASFQDYDMWIRLSQLGQFVGLNKGLSIMRHHSSDRTSVNLSKRFSGLSVIIKKWGADIEPIGDEGAFRRMFMSQAYAANARASNSYFLGNKFRLLSVIYDIGNRPKWLAFLVGLLGNRAYWAAYSKRHKIKDGEAQLAIFMRDYKIR